MKYIILFCFSVLFSAPPSDDVVFFLPSSPHNLRKNQELFAYHVSLLIQHIFSKGFTCTLGEAYRSLETAQLYAREHKGIAHSQHCFRLAIDLNLIDPNGIYLIHEHEYKQFGDYWISLDPIANRWGGNFTHGMIGDANHFERIEKNLQS